MDDLQLPARRITPWISPESGGTISTAAHRRARASVEPARTRRARAPRPGDGSMGGAGHPVHFLDACFLCRKPLAGNRDIFMYRGDTAFCSEECRTAQMEADEAAERTERACARRLTHGPPPAREVEDPQECGNKVRAGSALPCSASSEEVFSWPFFFFLFSFPPFRSQITLPFTARTTVDHRFCLNVRVCVFC